MFADLALSLYFLFGLAAYGKVPDGVGLLLFLGLAFFSLKSLLSLRKLVEAGVVPTSIWLALAANAGWYVYLGVAAITRVYEKPHPVEYLYLLIGLLNLACFSLSLIMWLRSRGILHRKTGTIQTK